MAIGSTSIVLKFEDVVGVFFGEEMERKVSISLKESIIIRGRSKEKTRRMRSVINTSPRGSLNLPNSPKSCVGIEVKLDFP